MQTKREELIKLRKQRGYTQEEIAEKLGISRSAYANYEHGRNEPSLEMAIKILEILRYKDIKIFLQFNATK